MELLCFSVFDKAAGAYIAPFFVPTEAVAVRSFSLACKASDHDFGRFPGDYSLHRVGQFATDTGAFTPCAPVCVVTGVQAAALVGGAA